MSCRLLVFISLSLFSWVSFASDLRNFHPVVPLHGKTSTHLLYRGAEPSHPALYELAGRGIKTILNLQSSRKDAKWEAGIAEALGMRVVHISVTPLLKRPSQEKLAEIIAFLKDPANYPLYIHCWRGKDRTGMAVALFRVYIEGVDPEVAYQEMLQYNFDPYWQAGLKCAYWEKTGLPLPLYCNGLPRADESITSRQDDEVDAEKIFFAKEKN